MVRMHLCRRSAKPTYRCRRTTRAFGAKLLSTFASLCSDAVLLQKIEKPFLDAVKETLDERYTDNIEEIYKITVRFILETLIAGYDKAGDGG